MQDIEHVIGTTVAAEGGEVPVASEAFAVPSRGASSGGRIDRGPRCGSYATSLRLSSEVKALVGPAEVAHLADCSTVENEYWTHVSAQKDLPIAPGAVPLGLVVELNALVAGPEALDPHLLHDNLTTKLLAEPTLLNQLRLLVSVSDKRLYLDLSYLFARTVRAGGNATLCGCAPHELTRHSTSYFENRLAAGGALGELAANVIATYFLDRGLGQMLELYRQLDADQRKVLILNLVLPGEFQQNEAKRRGHGAEASVALLVQELGVRFVPSDKPNNPMGAYDPNFSTDTFTIVPRQAGVTSSCDLAILNEDELPAVFVQGLVQSSDPGQFGVNKAAETVQIRRRMNEWNAAQGEERTVELWGIVDGVGYSENKAGTINVLLHNFHNFVQVNSRYKAGVALHRLGLVKISGIVFDMQYYTDATRDQMIERHVPNDIPVWNLDEVPDGLRSVFGGWASLYVAAS